MFWVLTLNYLSGLSATTQKTAELRLVTLLGGYPPFLFGCPTAGNAEEHPKRASLRRKHSTDPIQTT